MNPLNDQQLNEIEACVTGPLGEVTVFDHTTVGPLVAEVRRLRAVEAAAIEVHAKHKPRTERHGSGCVQCGIVWPCPTYNALNEAVRPAAETGA